VAFSGVRSRLQRRVRTGFSPVSLLWPKKATIKPYLKFAQIVIEKLYSELAKFRLSIKFLDHIDEHSKSVKRFIRFRLNTLQFAEV